MRAELAPFALDLLLGLGGLGILVAMRVVPWRASSMAAAFGLAYLTGAAVVPLALTVLLTLGVPFTLETFGAVTLACIGLGVLLGRARAGDRPPAPAAWWRRPWRSWSADVWVVAVFILAFGAFAVVGLATAFHLPLLGWDAWGFWTRKAQMLTWHDSLFPEFFAGSSYAFIHPDYPLQLPVFEALHFRAAGSIDTQTVIRHLWLLLAAFVWGAAYLLRDRVRPVVWAPLLLLAALAPGVWQQLLTGFADVPMAIFAGLGAISLALWLSQGAGGFLALAAVMLAAAANTKDEGLMVAVALLLVAGIVGLVRGLRLRGLLLACGGVLVAVLPWRVWTAAHGIKTDLPVSKGLTDPGYMLDRIDRVWPSIRALGHEMADQSRWLYLLPLATLVVVAALVSGTGRRVAAFYMASFAVVSAGFIWSYWLSPYPIEWHLENSAGRVISALMFICIAAVVHVSGLLLNALDRRQRRRDADGEVPTERAVPREPLLSNDEPGAPSMTAPAD